jgi:hypothetical protein
MDVDGALFDSSGHQLIRGKSIDMHSDNPIIWPRNIDDVVDDLRVARETDKSVVFYAHRITNGLVLHHHITPWGLEYVLHHASELGLQFLTASDLA